MGSMSIWHWLIVLVIVLVLFGGGGKIARVMGDMAKGVNAFRKNLKETDPNAPAGSETKSIPDSGETPAAGPANPQPSSHKANANL